MTIRTRLRRFLVKQRLAFGVLFERSRYPHGDGVSTADWHTPIEPTHPSLSCACPGGPSHIDHRPDCAWLAAMCKACDGEGTCASCGGDGCGRGAA